MTSNNTEQFQTSVLAELQALRQDLAELKGNQASSKPARKSSTKASKGSDPAEKKERKPRAPTSWDAFRAKVQGALQEGNLKANAMSYAKHLKDTFGTEAYEWDNEAIISAFSDYTPPEPKAKPKPTEAEAKPTEGEAKPKRTLTPEHVAKMQAGAAAKRARDKAEKEATQATAEPKATAPATIAVRPPPVPTPSALRPLPWKGKQLVWDPASNGTWLRGDKADDGSYTKGAWYGRLSADKKSLDTDASDPDA